MRQVARLDCPLEAALARGVCAGRRFPWWSMHCSGPGWQKTAWQGRPLAAVNRVAAAGCPVVAVRSAVGHFRRKRVRSWAALFRADVTVTFFRLKPRHP